MRFQTTWNTISTIFVVGFLVTVVRSIISIFSNGKTQLQHPPPNKSDIEELSNVFTEILDLLSGTPALLFRSFLYLITLPGVSHFLVFVTTVSILFFVPKVWKTMKSFYDDWAVNSEKKEKFTRALLSTNTNLAFEIISEGRMVPSDHINPFTSARTSSSADAYLLRELILDDPDQAALFKDFPEELLLKLGCPQIAEKVRKNEFVPSPPSGRRRYADAPETPSPRGRVTAPVTPAMRNLLDAFESVKADLK